MSIFEGPALAPYAEVVDKYIAEIDELKKEYSNDNTSEERRTEIILSMNALIDLRFEAEHKLRVATNYFVNNVESMASGGGVWLELHPYDLFASLFHEHRSKAVPYTTQTADDVHLTVLYLGKGVTDEQVEVLWREAVLPNLKKNFNFRLGNVHAGSWGPPEVVMMDVALLDQDSFDTLYRAFYAKALELGIKVAGTNASPDKHNGTHMTIDKRSTPPYSEGEMTSIKHEMEGFVDIQSWWRDIRIVRGGSQNVLKSHIF